MENQQISGPVTLCDLEIYHPADQACLRLTWTSKPLDVESPRDTYHSTALCTMHNFCEVGQVTDPVPSHEDRI